MCPIKGGDGGGAGFEDAASKDMPFLPGYAGMQERNAFTHPHTLSLLSRGRRKKEKTKLSGCVPSLSAGRPRARARRKRGTRLRFPAPKPPALANEKRRCPIRFVGRRIPEVVPTQGPSAMDAAQKIQNGLKLHQLSLSFLSFHLIKPNLISILN